MASYQFLSPEGETVNLNDVDERLCADSGLEVSPADFCSPYMWLVEAGIAIVLRTNATLITPEVVQQYLEIKGKESDDGEVNEAFQHFIEKYAPYLDGTIYQFTAWR